MRRDMRPGCPRQCSSPPAETIGSMLPLRLSVGVTLNVYEPVLHGSRAPGP